MNTIAGLLLNLLERYLLERDEALMERVLQQTGQAQAEPWLDGNQYPESDFRALLSAAAAELGVEPPALLRAVADWAVPQLLRRFNSLVAGLDEPLEFLEALKSTVYPQLSRMLRSDCPAHYSYERHGAQRALVTYQSERRLCAVLEGALAGLARHFGTPLQIRHERCQQHGDTRCELFLEFNGVIP